VKYPKWYQVAMKEVGVTEGEGTKSNPQILLYHGATKLKAMSDKTPWCASFVSWCLAQSGVRSPETARARTYLKFGITLRDPIPGCLVILSRGKASGHITFYKEALDDGHFLGLGGNQSDSVCFQAYPNSRILGYRWPIGQAFPPTS
jgi:uncharacterized protein (TIGR02594 family)